MDTQLQKHESNLEKLQQKINDSSDFIKQNLKPQPEKKEEGTTKAFDIEQQVKLQMLDHRLNAIQQKVDVMNPAFLATIEVRLQNLQGDIGELRNLYSSPTSSLNMVLDGMLKKLKDLEADVPINIASGRSNIISNGRLS